MSNTWQAYVDQYLMVPLQNAGGTYLESAAIVGLDGGIWAQSEAFPAATTEQLVELANSFTSESPPIQQSGLKLQDRKYMVVYFDPEAKVFRGKLGNGGISVKKALTCMVIGIYTEKDQVGDCNKIIEDMGEYLEGQAY